MTTVFWKSGVTTGDWNIVANWTSSPLPTLSDDVIIGNFGDAVVTIPSGYQALADTLELRSGNDVNYLPPDHGGTGHTAAIILATNWLNDLGQPNGLFVNHLSMAGDHASITGYGLFLVNVDIVGRGTITASGSQGLGLIGAGFDGMQADIAFVINGGSSLNIGGAVSATGFNRAQPTLSFAAGSLASPASFIDTAVSQTNVKLGTISGFTGSGEAHSDTMVLRSFGAGINDDVLSVSGNVVTIANVTDASLHWSYTFATPEMAASVHLDDSGDTDTLYSTFCFMAGTMIGTPGGEVAVETLKHGDLVTTTDGVAMPVSWLGKQTISTRFADPIRCWPIRVKAGALGENIPARDLLLSPDHALLVDGVLIQAGALVNGTSVVRETEVPRIFTYYHVELDDHSLILADAPAESFVDNVDRLNFDNWAEHEALYPEGKPIVELPYPRAKGRRQAPVNIRVAMAARAEAMGVVEAIAEVA